MITQHFCSGPIIDSIDFKRIGGIGGSCLLMLLDSMAVLLVMLQYDYMCENDYFG